MLDEIFKQAFGEFLKFQIKWPQVQDSVYYMNVLNFVSFDLKAEPISAKNLTGRGTASWC